MGGLEVIQMIEKDPMWMRDHWDDHVLDRSYFRRYSQIVRAIPKPVNSSENQRPSDVESR